VCNGAPLKYANNGVIALNYDYGNASASTPVMSSSGNSRGTVIRTKAQADAIVTTAVSLWTNVPTSTVNLGRGPDLPVDVNASNFGSYIESNSTFSDGLFPVVYDYDGALVDRLLGTNMRNSVL